MVIAICMIYHQVSCKGVSIDIEYTVLRGENMKKFKIIGYVIIGFEKIIECESFEEAEEQANVIALTEDVDGRDMNEWFDSVEVEEVEELEE